MSSFLKPLLHAPLLANAENRAWLDQSFEDWLLFLPSKRAPSDAREDLDPIIPILQAELWEGDATKQKSVKKKVHILKATLIQKAPSPELW